MADPADLWAAYTGPAFTGERRAPDTIDALRLGMHQKVEAPDMLQGYPSFSSAPVPALTYPSAGFQVYTDMMMGRLKRMLQRKAAEEVLSQGMTDQPTGPLTGAAPQRLYQGSKNPYGDLFKRTDTPWDSGPL
tara:strand:+ start:3040 stop:3438 length:399 start_codon:yes stop_codon:yes gene_type:complete